MPRISAARREIIYAYETLKKNLGDKVTVRHVAKFLGYTIDKNNNNSTVRKVIKEYLATNS